MTGRHCVALWAPAQDSFSSAPSWALLLNQPSRVWQGHLRNAAAELAYTYASYEN